MSSGIFRPGVTIFTQQGHYTLDCKTIIAYPAADLTVERIGDLVDYDLTALLDRANSRVRDRSDT